MDHVTIGGSAYISALYRALGLSAKRTPIIPYGPVHSLNLVSVGTLEQLYKGIDTLVEAVRLLNERGDRVRLVHLGDGRCRPQLERLAARLSP